MTKTARQLVRYATVGLVSNMIGFLLYLILTYAGMGHKLAMTLLYGMGVAQTFLFNKRWTFSHDGAFYGPFVRYVSSYALGYLLNLAALLIFVDWAQWPHQIVQGVMIFVLAGMLFLLQKYWVFAKHGVPHQV